MHVERNTTNQPLPPAGHSTITPLRARMHLTMHYTHSIIAPLRAPMLIPLYTPLRQKCILQSTIQTILPYELIPRNTFQGPNASQGLGFNQLSQISTNYALCKAPNTSWHCSLIEYISVAVDKVHTVHCGVHCTVCNKALTNGESEVLTSQVPQPLLLVKSVGEPD